MNTITKPVTRLARRLLTVQSRDGRFDHWKVIDRKEAYTILKGLPLRAGDIWELVNNGEVETRAHVVMLGSQLCWRMRNDVGLTPLA